MKMGKRPALFHEKEASVVKFVVVVVVD